MRFSFKKIAALGASLVLTGMSMGMAAAASYPAPFVQNGNADVAIVYGSGAMLDQQAAQKVSDSLNSSYAGSNVGGSVTASGEAVRLDTSSQRIWLNTSLNSIKSGALTKLDLPTVLADTTFSGNVQATLTQNIQIGAGTTGQANGGKVILYRMPSSNDDPTFGISASVNSADPMYNATIIFSKPVDFTSASSQGETLTMFGNDFVVSSDSSMSNGIVLFSSAQSATLNVGGSGSPTATVTIDGTDHTVTLSSVDATSNKALISIDGNSAQWVSAGTSKSVGGVSVAVTNVASSNAAGDTATILVGANTLTFKDGQAVTSSNGDTTTTIQGTMVHLTGTYNATTKLVVSVAAPDTLHNSILPGSPFVDPVFGSFKIDFGGLSSPIGDSSRDTVKLSTSGDSLMTIDLPDASGLEFAYNNSGGYNLSTSTGYPIYPYEMANLSLYSETFVGNGNYGHFIKLQSVSMDPSNPSNDKVTFSDVLTGDSYTTVYSGTAGTLTLPMPEGQQYTVTYNGTGTSQWAEIKSPDSSGAGTFILYPTMGTPNGAMVGYYEPLSLSLADFDGQGDAVTGFMIPTGDPTVGAGGYKSITVTGSTGNYTIGGTNVSAGTTATVSVGQLKYNFKLSGTVLTSDNVNVTLVQPGTTATDINQPSVVVFEGKDNDANYNAVVVTTQNPSANSDKVGVDQVYFTSTKYQSGAQPLASTQSKVNDYADWFGTVVSVDSTTSGQKTASVSVPKEQAYANVFVGAASSSVSGSGADIGNIIFTDNEASSFATKNIVVVGGSCVNTVAATLLGSSTPMCTDAWTSATNVGSGQFLIQSFGPSAQSVTSKVAVLVAGYEAADTLNAATYLTTQKPDVSAGKKYIGTSATSAQLQVS